MKRRSSSGTASLVSWKSQTKLYVSPASRGRERKERFLTPLFPTSFSQISQIHFWILQKVSRTDFPRAWYVVRPYGASVHELIQLSPFPDAGRL
jgi:hypothetical protein